MAKSHWVAWHDAYDEPTSSLSRRLAIVQRRLSDALDVTPEGPIRLISMCAGQGRDVVGVLATHSRANDVQARLVELDERLVSYARESARRAGLAGVEIVHGDASSTSAYAGMTPAQVALVCGVFGNVSDADVRATVFELPRLVAAGAHVIWTRHRAAPDLTPTIREWFGEAGFDDIAFDTDDSSMLGVGTVRFSGAPAAFQAGRRMFSFVGDGTTRRVVDT